MVKQGELSRGPAQQGDFPWLFGRREYREVQANSAPISREITRYFLRIKTRQMRRLDPPLSIKKHLIGKMQEIVIAMWDKY